MAELYPLEQIDLLEFERKELLLRFMEQSAQIFATAPSKEAANALVDALRVEFFVDYEASQDAQRKLETEELLAMQKLTYKISATRTGGAVLEIGKGEKP